MFKQRFLTVLVVGTQSYSQARMPESDHVDNNEEKSNQYADIESSGLKSSDLTEHKSKVNMEGIRDEVDQETTFWTKL